MPIDTRIPLGIRPIEMPNPLQQAGQVMQMQSMMQRNKLYDLSMQEKMREAEQENALSRAYRDAVDAEGKIDRTKVLTTAAQSGLGAKIPALQKGFAEQDKATADAQKSKIETDIQKLEFVGRVAGSVKDPLSFAAANQRLMEMGIPPLGNTYNPVELHNLSMMALSKKDQLEQERKAMEHQLNVAKFGYQQQNDAANRSVTIRGQNLTDARGREANELKAEENSIKRAEKKATDDLTKNSQVASFDTMLGTLDRLSTHKGLSRSVGFMGSLPTRPGSESANFQAELNTFQSQAFLPMVAQLKGMGALSDAEGKKLTAAVGALDPTMGEEAFRASIGRIKADMEAARARVAGTPRAQAAPQSGPQVGAVEGGYRFKGGDPADRSSWEKAQ